MVRPNGIAELNAHYILELDDGALVFVESTGISDGLRDPGKPRPPEQVYFRMVPRFETTSTKHRWLMEQVFVAKVVRRGDLLNGETFQVH